MSQTLNTVQASNTSLGSNLFVIQAGLRSQALQHTPGFMGLAQATAWATWASDKKLGWLTARFEAVSSLKNENFQ